MAETASEPIADVNTTELEFLFVQRAQSGSLSKINENEYALELKNVANETIRFSDRPNRIVETVATYRVIESWAKGDNNFASDAPNAALIVEDINTGKLETVIVALFDPVYDADTKTLVYTITAQSDAITETIGEFGPANLVIDTALCAGCGGRQCPPCRRRR